MTRFRDYSYFPFSNLFWRYVRLGIYINLILFCIFGWAYFEEQPIFKAFSSTYYKVQKYLTGTTYREIQAAERPKKKTSQGKKSSAKNPEKKRKA